MTAIDDYNPSDRDKSSDDDISSKIIGFRWRQKQVDQQSLLERYKQFVIRSIATDNCEEIESVEIFCLTNSSTGQDN